MLRLTMFGGVAVRATPDAAGAANLPRRTLALLVLIAATPEPGVSRDTLLAYLWPESDDEHGRSALRQALHVLRRALESPELMIGNITLQLDPKLISADLWDFERARATGDLEGAIACYAGPFLDGFHVGGVPEFERWVERQRADYAQRTAGLLEALARGARQRGDSATAVQWWRRLAQLDPLSTSVTMELMADLVDSGNAAGALRHARDHEALVRDELGAGPDRALAVMVQRIREGATEVGRPATVPDAAAGVRLGLPKTAGASPPLRERFADRFAGDLADRYTFDCESEPGREGAVRLCRAHDRRHDRIVGVKVLVPSLASHIDAERFVREIRLTGKLAHPNILPLLDSGEVGGRPWFAVPWHEGETLRARLARDGVLPAAEAWRLIREVADALQYAHGSGVVHRDVCPENILLSGGHAILTNLGLARALDSAAASRLTESATLVGTPAYMSPEQADGHGEVDGRSDVYALGAVLFELLSGEPLFSGPTVQAIMAKRAAHPTPPRDRLRDLPAGAPAILRKALARSPADRYQSIAAMAKALDAVARDSAPRWPRLVSRLAQALGFVGHG
jgi:DNA-binding SARP family transcriptional activator